MDGKKRKKVAFDEKLEIYLLELILKRKFYLFGPLGGQVNKDIRNCSWNKVLDHVIEAGGDKDLTVDQIKDRYHALRQNTIRKRDRAKLTGMGKVPNYNDLDNLIIQIIGKDSSKLSPLKVRDPEPSFKSRKKIMFASQKDEG